MSFFPFACFFFLKQLATSRHSLPLQKELQSKCLFPTREPRSPERNLPPVALSLIRSIRKMATLTSAGGSIGVDVHYGGGYGGDGGSDDCFGPSARPPPPPPAAPAVALRLPASALASLAAAAAAGQPCTLSVESLVAGEAAAAAAPSSSRQAVRKFWKFCSLSIGLNRRRKSSASLSLSLSQTDSLRRQRHLGIHLPPRR